MKNTGIGLNLGESFAKPVLLDEFSSIEAFKNFKKFKNL